MIKKKTVFCNNCGKRTSCKVNVDTKRFLCVECKRFDEMVNEREHTKKLIDLVRMHESGRKKK